MIRDDGRRDLAKAIPILEVAERLGVYDLKPAGLERVGPCPVCGGGARADRFAINPAKGIWLCRQCPDAPAGDQIALVQHVQGCDFRAALAWLVGEAEAAPDPADLARRRAAAQAAEDKRAQVAETMRARAIRDAREIWTAAGPGADSPAAAYLAGRGITFKVWPPTLRFAPDHPYLKSLGGQLRALHRGPCMIAAVQAPGGQVRAVHQTWIDPDQPGQKAAITAPDGAAMPAKMVRGSKKGGAIRLTPQDPEGRMVMAEGIETTASALMAGVWPGATFWAGVDLGNIAGIMARRPGARWSGEPDLSDADAFVPPPWVRRLLLAQDGDSDPERTRAQLQSGAIRAMARRPGLLAEIMRADAGADLNDMLQDRAAQEKNDVGEKSDE